MIDTESEDGPLPPEQKRSFGLPDFITAVRDVATSSAMSPLQWIAGIVATAAVPVMIWAPDGLIRGGAFGLLVLTVTFVFYSYNHFMRKDPNRLQSERFVHAQARLKQEGKLLIDERNRGNQHVLDAQPVPNIHPPQFSTETTTDFRSKEDPK